MDDDGQQEDYYVLNTAAWFEAVHIAPTDTAARCREPGGFAMALLPMVINMAAEANPPTTAALHETVSILIDAETQQQSVEQ